MSDFCCAQSQIMLQAVYLLMADGAADGDNGVFVAIGLVLSTLRVGSTAILNDARHVTKESNGVKKKKFWLRAAFRATEIMARQLMFVLMVCFTFTVNQSILIIHGEAITMKLLTL